jgi:hypothetical protein
VIHQLALASLMVLVTIVIHLLGLGALIRLLRTHQQMGPRLHMPPILLLLFAALGLLATHTVEIWLYAGLYLALHAAADFESALYFSTGTYASIGYGDVLLSKSWRILGAIEGATGVVMLGWSTAFLVSVLSQLKLFAHDWLSPTRL